MRAGGRWSAAWLNARVTLPFRAVLFDLDGTLHDRHVTIERYLRGHGARFAHPAEFAERFTILDDFGYRGKREVFEVLAREFSLDVSSEELLADYEAFGWSECQLMPFAHEVIDELRRASVRVGVVTNGWVTKQQACLNALDLTSRVDVVIISEAVGVAKPHAEIFMLALDALGVPAGETLFVGDSPVNDVVGPRAVGMRVAYLPTGHRLPDGVIPDFVVADLRDVLDVALGSVGLADAPV